VGVPKLCPTNHLADQS